MWPPSRGDLLQLLTGTSDGQTIDDSIGDLDAVEMRNAYTPKWNGIASNYQNLVIPNSVALTETGFTLTGKGMRTTNSNTASPIAGMAIGTGSIAATTFLCLLNSNSKFYFNHNTSQFFSQVVGFDVPFEFSLTYDPVTYDATLVINGVSDTINVGKMRDANGDVYIGTTQGGSTTTLWDGQLWDIALSYPESAFESVIIISGQSNAEGGSTVFAPEPYDAAQTNHYFTYSINAGAYTGTDEDLQPTPAYPLKWGVELSMGLALSDPHTFIKQTTGGQKLYNYWNPGQTHLATPIVRGAGFTLLSNLITSAYTAIYARNKIPFVKAFVWIQGESDINGIYSQNYYDEFLAMWKALTEENFIPKSTKIVLARLSDGFIENTAYPDGAAEVQACQDALASRLNNVTIVNTDGLPLHDGVHYTAAGLIELGQTMAGIVETVETPSSLEFWRYPLSEGAERPVYDSSGHNRHTQINGTSGGVTAGAITTLRAARQDLFSANLLRGFGSLVPIENVMSNSQFVGTNYWTLGTGWTVSNGKARCDGSQTGVSTLYVYLALASSYPASTLLYYAFDLEVQAGELDVYDPNLATYVGNYTTGGRKEGYITTNGVYNTFTLRADADFVGTVTNVVLGQASPSGVTIPAVDGTNRDIYYNPLANKPGKVHNGCEVDLIQTDDSGALIDAVRVLVDGQTAYRAYTGLSNGKPRYSETDTGVTITVEWDGANWVTTVGGLGSSTHPTSTSFHPPKTGWPDIGAIPLSIAYSSFWVDDSGDYIARDYADFVARVNGDDHQLDRWLGDNVQKVAVYSQEGAT